MRRPHRPGLWDGLAGVAWLQRRLGRHAQADAALARLRALPTGALGADLGGGLPGIGLLLLDELEADPTLLADALEIGEELPHRHAARPPIAEVPEERRVATKGTGGLLRGASGTALFALRLYEKTGDPEHLRLAEDALDYDLAHCLHLHGRLPAGQRGLATRALPRHGLRGIGLVIAQVLPYTAAPDRYREALEAIRAAALTDFVIEPGSSRARRTHPLPRGAMHARAGHPRDDRRTATPRSELQTACPSPPAGNRGSPARDCCASCDFATGIRGCPRRARDGRDDARRSRHRRPPAPAAAPAAASRSGRPGRRDGREGVTSMGYLLSLQTLERANDDRDRKRSRQLVQPERVRQHDVQHDLLTPTPPGCRALAGGAPASARQRAGVKRATHRLVRLDDERRDEGETDREPPLRGIKTRVMSN